MIIAVDTEELQEEQGNFLHECLQRIIPASPQHFFILLSKNNLLTNYKAFSNCLVILLEKKRRFSSLKEINHVLKQQKAEIIITSGFLLAAFVKIKTCLLSPSLQQFSFDEPKRFFKSFLLKKVYKKASLIYTAWEQDKNNIADKYKIPEGQVQVIHYGLNDVSPLLDFEQQQIIQLKYAEGNAYFLIVQSHIEPSDLLIFLKAFSIFKKKFKSTMKLVIYSGNYNGAREELDKVLKDYRFKSDVLFINGNEIEPTELFNAAYAVIFNRIKKDDLRSALKTLATSSNVICLRTAIAKEIYADAALYYTEFKPEQMADNMIAIYKDENLKKTLSAKQQGRQAFFSWDRAATDLLRGIENALS
jgi:hypothetical protein